MARLPFKRHRYPFDVIRHAVCLYFRFTPSFRDVEELLPQRGMVVLRKYWIRDELTLLRDHHRPVE